MAVINPTKNQITMYLRHGIARIDVYKPENYEQRDFIDLANLVEIEEPSGFWRKETSDNDGRKCAGVMVYSRSCHGARIPINSLDKHLEVFDPNEQVGGLIPYYSEGENVLKGLEPVYEIE